MAGLLDVSKDEARMHLIGWLPENASDKIAAGKAARQNLETTPLSLYAFESLPVGGALILGYTAFTPGQIKTVFGGWQRL